MYIFKGRRCPETAANNPIYGAGDFHAGRRIHVSATPKSVKPVLRDCDLCPAKKVWCITFVTGESRMVLLVCNECQLKRVLENPIQSKRNMSND
jgi:hypothetical protein